MNKIVYDKTKIDVVNWKEIFDKETLKAKLKAPDVTI